MSWYDSNWSHRKQITIDNTKVSGNESNFPVLISIASDSHLANNAISDGHGILFTSSDGTTKLDHEIEKYNNATGKLIAWVKVPALSSSADTVLYMYYGAPETNSSIDSTSSKVETMNVTSFSWSHVVNTSDNTILVVGIAWRNLGPAESTVQSVTYGGNACTLIRKDHFFQNSSRSTALYYLINPPLGSNTVQVTFDEEIYRTVGGAVSFTGINLSQPINSHSGASGQSGTNATTNITSINDDVWIMDVIIDRSSTTTSTPGAQQSEQWNLNSGSNGITDSCSTKELNTAGTTSMSWTLDSGLWSHSIVALKKAETADQQNVSGVWSNGFVSVYHLKEDPSAVGANGVVDSAGSHHGTAMGTMDSGNHVSGKIGYGVSFDGIDEEISNTGQSYAQLTKYTISCWVSLVDVSGDDGGQIFHLYDSGNASGRKINFFQQSSSGSTPRIFYRNDASTSSSLNWGSVFNNGQLYYIVATHDTTTGNLYLYVNGGVDASNLSFITGGITPNAFSIGRVQKDGATFHHHNGTIDEVRVSSDARSGSWIQTEYNNQNNPSGFYSISSPETEGGGGAIPDVTNYYIIEQPSQQLTTSTSFVDITGAELSFTPDDTSQTWMIYATGVCTTDNVAEQSFEMRLVINGVECDLWSHQINSVSNPNGAGFFSFNRITGVDTLQTVKLQYRSIVGTTYASQMTILAARVPDNADFQYYEDDPITQTTGADQIIDTFSFTPSSSGNYYIIAKISHREGPSGSTSQAWFEGSDGTLHPDSPAGVHHSCARDPWNPLTCVWRENLTATSKTFNFRFTSSATGSQVSEHRYRKIMIFREDAWDAAYYDLSAAQSTVSLSTFQLKNTITVPSPPVSQDFISLQCARIGGDDSSGSSAKAGELRIGGSAKTRTNHRINRPNDAAQGYHHTIGLCNARTETGSVTYENGFLSPNGTAVGCAESAIVVLRYPAPTSEDSIHQMIV